MKTDNNIKDDIDNWFFNKLIKGIIDSIILLLKMFRPDDTPTPTPDNPSPIIPLPNKPIFPWLRKRIDNIIKEENNE